MEQGASDELRLIGLILLRSGGYLKGRIIEIHDQSGKTTAPPTLSCASTEKEGGIAAFIDAEHALDPAYAAKLLCEH